MPITPFIDLPSAPRYALRRVTLPASLVDGRNASSRLPRAGLAEDDLVHADLVVADGRIEAVEPPGRVPAELGPDLGESMVLPCMLDAHTHLDKGHIWPRQRNPDGTHGGASKATGEDRSAHWSASDVRARMEFGLATAYAKGVVAIRTHLDSLRPQAAISFGVFAKVRDEWAGRIDLQASSIAPLDIFLTDEGRELADIVAAAGGNLGCFTRFRAQQGESMAADFDRAMTGLLTLAAERGLNVDLHVDEATDPNARSLRRIAELALKVGFKGRILCGHCCALALQTDEYIASTLALCREAGIDIVSLPIVNMYLQDRRMGADGQRRTPHWRGVTTLHEAKAAGLRVAVAGDNCRDPFHAYGDHDMLDTFTQSVRIAHLDHPLGDWITAATSQPADIMGLPQRGRLHVGSGADLMVLKARDYSEMLSRPQFDRVVVRGGRVIDTNPPDYRLLDEVVGR